MKKVDIILSWIVSAFLTVTIILLLSEFDSLYTNTFLVFISIFNFILLIVNTFFRKKT